jgi:hypothetical protein
MNFLDRIFSKKILREQLIGAYQDHAHRILAYVEKNKPFYSVLFPGQNLVDEATKSLNQNFVEISNLESRKVQIRRLIGLYFRITQEEITFNYLSYECPDELLPLYSTIFIDLGNRFLGGLAIGTITMGQDYHEFAKPAKAYFKKAYYFEVFKNNVLRTLVTTLSGEKGFNHEDLRRYDILVKEHLKKMGVELILQNAEPSNEVLYPLSLEYDFNELKLRSDLIDQFIQGVELDTGDVIDDSCEKFPQVMQKNYECFKRATAYLKL